MSRKWSVIEPEGAISSTGGEWRGFFGEGDPDRVIVYFHGGGLSMNEYMAARSFGAGGGFYADNSSADMSREFGIIEDCDENPFREWTVLGLTYSTGDAFVGRSEFPYTSIHGTSRILYHKGYDNYSAFMRCVRGRLGDVRELVICGFSAGGFATALLADDIITNYFPDCGNITVLCDSATLFSADWKRAATDVWNTPREISDRLVTLDATADVLAALRAKFGSDRVKILYACSTRDDTLSAFQAYMDGCEFRRTPEALDRFEALLRREVRDMTERVPDIAFYIWDQPNSDRPERTTQHTVICFRDFYRERFADGVTVAEWLRDAVNGDVRSHGLDKLK